MKVLIINASPSANGLNNLALAEMEQVFLDQGIEVDIVRVGSSIVRGCIACGRCGTTERAVHRCWRYGRCTTCDRWGTTGACELYDVVNELAGKFEEADGLVVAASAQYGPDNATLSKVHHYLFYKTRFDKTMKVGCAISASNRGAINTTWDEADARFRYSGMPIASGEHRKGPRIPFQDKTEQDAEDMRLVRTLARNMAFLMKAIALAKDAYGLPEQEPSIFTNFVR